MDLALCFAPVPLKCLFVHSCHRAGSVLWPDKFNQRLSKARKLLHTLPRTVLTPIIVRMRKTVSLPVLMPKIPDQRWSCHSCGNCCRTLVGHLFDDECERVDRQGWKDKLGVAPYVKIGRNRVLNKREDGACVFLDESKRCKIHAEYGEDAKPVACRMFPFSVRPIGSGWQASLRFDCPSVISSKGQPVSHYHFFLTNLVKKLDHKAPSGDEAPLLQRRLRATADEIDTVITRFRQWLRSHDLSVNQRVVGLARITTTLEGASFAKVRGPRFAELLDLLFGVLPNECRNELDPPTRRQRGMLRQAAFAHAEHVTLTEMRAGVLGRLGKRWHQLRCAKRFRIGRGLVPQLPGFEGSTMFETVESVKRPTERTEEIDELLLRYVTGRLESRSVFGHGYYGWPVLNGLGALWLSLSVVGWLARYAAALEGTEAVAFDRVGLALGIVDRAATRLPALGTVAERMRLTYLLGDSGVARLLHEYSVAGDQ